MVFLLQVPQEITFGDAYFVNQFTGPKRKKVRKFDSFYYVPLLDTLHSLLTLQEVQEVFNTSFAARHELQEFCDGLIYKCHPLFQEDKTALQIIGYYDEVEVVNPIGSYVSKHKLGCLFFTLGNVQPKYRSSLKSIHLVAVGKHEHIARYGIDLFLAPFVNNIKSLYCDGIEINRGKHTQRVHGGLLAFLADNLAAHAVGGFKESMSFSLRICRSCMITTEESQVCFSEQSCHLRDPETHFRECQMLDGPLASHYSTNFGINRRSVLEDIPGFSVVTGIPHDVTNDLFEGVVPYEMKLLILHLIQNKYISIRMINERLQQFDFVQNKASRIDSNLARSGGKLRQSASQMMALSRYFPLLIGDKIPLEDEHWCSFLLLLKICSIFLTPVCTPDTIPFLRILIEEKLSTFKELYPGSKLIPKHHYMIHYPTQIEQFGPLVHSWTMRQESKLSFVKQVSRKSNFKNVPQTVAKKHQLWQCYKIHVEGTYLQTKYKFSPKTTECLLHAEEDCIIDEVRQHIPSVGPTTRTHHPASVALQGAVYYKGVFVLLHYDYITPKFGKIQDITVVYNEVFLSLRVFVSDIFVSHYNAYQIYSTDSVVVLSLSKLSFPFPLFSKQNISVSDKNLYIALPFLF